MTDPPVLHGNLWCDATARRRVLRDSGGMVLKSIVTVENKYDDLLPRKGGVRNGTWNRRGINLTPLIGKPLEKNGGA